MQEEVKRTAEEQAAQTRSLIDTSANQTRTMKIRKKKPVVPVPILKPDVNPEHPEKSREMKIADDFYSCQN